jgi:short-subunit dehydrogenase
MNKKNILITGSSQGIGLEIAKHFSKEHNVYINGRYKEKLEKL